MILQTTQEIKNLLYYGWMTRHLIGDVVEIGVYRGGSAEVLHFCLRHRDLHLFDTFGANDNGVDDQFDWTDALNTVILRTPGSHIHIGPFTGDKLPKSISLAHIDVDSEDGTMTALTHVYPRMVKGGAILVHDYQNGGLKVRDAVNSFMGGKEPVIPLHGSTQCVILKQ